MAMTLMANPLATIINDKKRHSHNAAPLDESANAIGDISRSEDGDEMPPRSSTDDRLAEAMSLLAEAVAAQINSGNNKKLSERVGTWMPAFLTLAVLGVTAIRFDTSRERDTAAEIRMLQTQVQQLQKSEEDFQTTKTWWEKVRLNLADSGWLVDPTSGNVTRKRSR